jgi:hypothetical protein
VNGIHVSREATKWRVLVVRLKSIGFENKKYFEQINWLQSFLSINTFAGTVTLDFSLKVETCNTPADARLSTCDNFAGTRTDS